jgi:imidazolonepropionase-like amidohydrolase
VSRPIRILYVALMILAVAIARAAPDNTPANATAFVHASIVPMDRERVLEDWTVIVVDGRIRELGPSSAISIPDRATVIDARGKYLMPGLADMHAHSWGEDDFPLLLANGVTTIRNMFGGPIHLEWKKRIAAGAFDGPTIYTAGPIIDGNPPIWPGAVVETSEQAHDAVAGQRAAGYDFLKVYSRLSREAYDAINREGKAVGMKVTGHVPDAVGLAAALRSGMDSIEHLSGIRITGANASPGGRRGGILGTTR